MDKYQGYMDSKQITKRPRWLTLCMMATAASVLVLAGCGDDEPVAPPAGVSDPVEQGATTQSEQGTNESSALEQDSTMNEESANQNAMSDESASEGSMTQGSGANSEQPMSNQGMSNENMPEDTMDEPVEGNTNPGEEDEAGFGEGTDPMPGAEDDENSTSNQ